MKYKDVITNEAHVRPQARMNPFDLVVSQYWGKPSTQAVFRALFQKVKQLPFDTLYITWNNADFRRSFLQSGVDLEYVFFELCNLSEEACLDEEESRFVIHDTGFLWKNNPNGSLTFFISDREKMEDFLESKQGVRFKVYPHKTQRYKDITFDLTTGEIFKSGKQIDKIELGTDYEKLIKLLLENRGYNFSYLELARTLGIEQLYTRNKFDTEKSISTKFSRLNAKCREKVFQCNNGYFVAI